MVGSESGTEKKQGLVDAILEDVLFGTYQTEVWPVPEEHGQVRMLGQIRDMLKNGDPRVEQLAESLKDLKKLSDPGKIAHQITDLAYNISESQQAGAQTVSGALAKTTEGIRDALAHSEGTSRQVGSAITGRIIEPTEDLSTLFSSAGAPILSLFEAGALKNIDPTTAENLYIAVMKKRRGGSMDGGWEEYYRKEFHDRFEHQLHSITPKETADQIMAAVRFHGLDTNILEKVRRSGYISPDVEKELVDRGILESYGLDGIHRGIRQLNRVQMASLSMQEEDLGLSGRRNELLEHIKGTLDSELSEANDWLENIYKKAAQSSKLLGYMNGTLGKMLEEQVHTNGYLKTMGEQQAVQIRQGTALLSGQKEMLAQMMEVSFRQIKEQRLQQEEMREVVLRSFEGVLLFLQQAFSGMTQLLSDRFSAVSERLGGIRDEIQKQGEESERIKCNQYRDSGMMWLRKRKYEKAKKDLIKAIDLSSTDFQSNVALALCEMGLNDVDASEEQLEASMECAHGENEKVYTARCWSRLKRTQGDLPGAIRIVEKLLQELPQNKPLRFLYAEYVLADGEKEKAVRILQQLISEDHTYLYRLGESEECKKSVKIYEDIMMPMIRRGEGGSSLFVLFAMELYLLGNDKLMRQSMLLALQKDIHLVLQADETTRVLFLAQKEVIKTVLQNLWEEKKNMLSSENIYSLVLLYHYIYPEDEKQALLYMMEGFTKDENVRSFLSRKAYSELCAYFTHLYPDGEVLLRMLAKCGNVPIECRKFIHEHLVSAR